MSNYLPDNRAQVICIYNIASNMLGGLADYIYIEVWRLGPVLVFTVRTMVALSGACPDAQIRACPVATERDLKPDGGLTPYGIFLPRISEAELFLHPSPTQRSAATSLPSRRWCWARGTMVYNGMIYNGKNLRMDCNH
jgi:hypothetical protein